ncbi:MAG TPA: peptidase domain-containing ABC transporter [Chitinophagaceae bacterium]|jgi:ATP-binding cassette subfamily B protein|nr:peptidase domain-containing ABC transporter [Chitinophagaceae bacterium]
MKIKSFPFYRQIESMDCGPTCLRMIAKYYGKNYSLDTLREKSFINRQGVSMLGISDAAEAIGLRSSAALATYDALIEEQPLPAIIHWRHNHFIVLYRIDKKERAYIADPAHGYVRLSKNEFVENWSGTVSEGEKEGMILFFEPAPEFYQQADAKPDSQKRGLRELLYYLLPYKRYLIQLALALITGTLLQFAFPFLTQSVVDVGITNADFGFINLVLLAQLMLFLGRTAGDFIRSWILLHVGTRINISMVSDFLLKLTKLPIAFFDMKQTGDIMQRVNDHQSIQRFITNSVISTLFSVFNLVMFSIILLWYNVVIFSIFLFGSVLYVGWILLFLKKRKDINYRQFAAISSNHNSLIQFVMGMQEIKMNNAERQNRWKWERVQAKLFRISIKGLSLEQFQQIGSSFINELKNIIITFVAAKAVIGGDITLGMMLSIQYIIGQLNAPVAEFVMFIRSWQDAKISLERVGEIFSKEDEETNAEEKIVSLPIKRSLYFENTAFQYGGPNSPLVLQDVNFEVQQGKVTAIVGSSGSGKTTLLKLLLRFYSPVTGKIKIGNHDLEHLRHSFWRQQCGVVMQDGYIFSDTIAKNIAVADEVVDRERLLYAAKVANIHDFIDELPLTYNTKIGSDGIGMSGGQKQRILIARAVYKNPEFIFFDEATSSLDAENEKVIMENLDTFFKGKTVVIIAHRLSTVKNADQIIVLNKGEIIERGTHAELTKLQGTYYSLVKNQLELGN